MSSSSKNDLSKLFKTSGANAFSASAVYSPMIQIILALASVSNSTRLSSKIAANL